jgi:hypothetical protein
MAQLAIKEGVSDQHGMQANIEACILIYMQDVQQQFGRNRSKFNF